jgi:RNA polymerase sigma-54 factor
MELPLMDLREKIGEELARNPALEVLKEPGGAVSLDAAAPPKEGEEYFEAASDPGFVRTGGEEASRTHRSFIEGALARAETLQEHLLRQFRLEPVDGDIRRIGELLIQNLDGDGFHKEPVALLLKGEPAARIERAMNIVRRLDPTGTCTADYRESLLAQIEIRGESDRDLARAIPYLAELERGKFDLVGKKLRCSAPEAERLLRRIQTLSPFPGRRFYAGDTRYVAPDVQILEKEGGFVIRLNNEDIPVLGIHPFFMQVSSRGSGSPEDRQARDFARENIREARWFIQSINQRNHTLLRVSRAILLFQKRFFEKGPRYLAPLTLRDIASEIGVHETTVSRASHGKYMQTRWGIFEIRYFFTNSISGSGSQGSPYSKEGVKEIIKDIISRESRRFSDQEIARILAEQGIPLARRTVAKYRAELELGSSFTRRRPGGAEALADAPDAPALE